VAAGISDFPRRPATCRTHRVGTRGPGSNQPLLGSRMGVTVDRLEVLGARMGGSNDPQRQSSVPRGLQAHATGHAAGHVGDLRVHFLQLTWPENRMPLPRPITFVPISASEARSHYEQRLHIVVARASVLGGDLSASSSARSLVEGNGDHLESHAAELVGMTPGDDDRIAWYLVDSPENRARVVEQRFAKGLRPASQAAQLLFDRHQADEGIERIIQMGIAASSLAKGELWPAWSTGEMLAVALALDRQDVLDAMEFTKTEAERRVDVETVAAMPEIRAAIAAAANG